MPTMSRVAIPSLLAAVALAGAVTLTACAGGTEPTACRSDGECPAASRCQAGVCVADATPVAKIRPPEDVEAFALVQLDGSESYDPDGAEDLAEHVWSIRSVMARCAPPIISGATAVARVRFGCEGRYEVSLVARDLLGVESSAATVEVDVRPASTDSVVVAGPDIATDHACSGEPLVCRPTDAVSLSATTLPGLAVRWIVEPPLDRPLEGGTRRVQLLPGPDVLDPQVAIETDGTSISGDWIFRVEASDEYGVVGAAYTRVSIRNRPPVLTADAPAPFPHAFDSSASLFTSSGEITWSVVDPDGDPLQTSATWRHQGDGGASFSGELKDATVTFALRVPYAAPADALLLRGGPDLARTIEIVARDVNRAEGRLSIPVEIGNRLPQPTGGIVDQSAPHHFDPASSRYLATVRLGTWADPDGDPLSVGPGAAPCDALTLENGAVVAHCSAAFEGTPAVDRIAGTRAIAVPVRDPWSSAAQVPVYSVEIQDSPPTLSVTRNLAVLWGSTGGWSMFDIASCTNYIVWSAQFTAIPATADPDGDPVLLAPVLSLGATASPQQVLCTGSNCLPFQFSQPSYSHWCTPPLATPSRLRATDGYRSVEINAAPPIYWL